MFIREHSAGTYRTDVYFLTKQLADLPIFLLTPVLFMSIYYWMVGFYADVYNFITTVIHIITNIIHIICLVLLSITHLMSLLVFHLLHMFALRLLWLAVVGIT